MPKYINKDEIVNKIQKEFEYWKNKEHNRHSIESETRMSECQTLLLMLNTCETKEF